MRRKRIRRKRSIKRQNKSRLIDVGSGLCPELYEYSPTAWLLDVYLIRLMVIQSFFLLFVLFCKVLCTLPVGYFLLMKSVVIQACFSLKHSGALII